MLECSQLFEPLRLFEWRGLKPGETQQELATIGVETDVLKRARGHTLVALPLVWDGATREVEGIAVGIDDDFHNVGIVQIRCSYDRTPDRRHQSVRTLVQQRFYREINSPGVDQWLVGLKIDHDVTPQVLRGFGETLSSAAVAGCSHACLTAKPRHGITDSRIVRGHEYLSHARRSLGTPVDVLHHGATADVRKGFAGETRRLVSGGDDDDDRDGRSDGGRALGCDRVHGEYYHTDDRDEISWSAGALPTVRSAPSVRRRMQC